MPLHTFKYNKEKGTYEVIKQNKVIKECRTMQEATSFIAEKEDAVANKPKLSVVKKEEVGFGKWGVPTFLMKAEGTHYGDKDEEKK